MRDVDLELFASVNDYVHFGAFGDEFVAQVLLSLFASCTAVCYCSFGNKSTSTPRRKHTSEHGKARKELTTSIPILQRHGLLRSP